MIQPAYKPGEPILTDRLPARCPSCWRAEINTSLPVTPGSVHRLTCTACGWNEKYQLRGEASA